MTIIDYAQHLIRLEQLMRQAHDLCLDREYGQAQDIAQAIRTEARLLDITLSEMQQLTSLQR